MSSRTAAERFIHLIYSSGLTGAASCFAGRGGGEAMRTGGFETPEASSRVIHTSGVLKSSVYRPVYGSADATSVTRGSG